MNHLALALSLLAFWPGVVAAQSPADIRAALEPHDGEPDVRAVVTSVLASVAIFAFRDYMGAGARAREAASEEAAEATAQAEAAAAQADAPTP